MPGILITGSTGQVGGELVRLLRAQQPALELHTPDRSQMDLGDANSLRAAVRRLRPRWIINPAAYTAVDRAETEREEALKINAEAPRILGQEAAAIGAPILHFSTDYVFAGDGKQAYVETDATDPQSVYGQSKLEGERNLIASGAAHLIVRTSWVYAATGRNFLLTVMRVASQQPVMRIVADQRGAPTTAVELARLTASLLTRFDGNPAPEDAVRKVQGIYHATGAGETTWFGFAEEALHQRRIAKPDARFGALIPVTTAEYPTLARRPANSRLNCEKLARIFGIRMQPWQQALGEVLADIP